MIVVTGATGFIGSHLIDRLNQDNYNAIIAVDKFNQESKLKNLAGATVKDRIDRDAFLTWLDSHHEIVEFVFHLGARTNTAETNLLQSLNTDYTKEIWKRCSQYQIPMVYASSAATYGAGEFGFDDDESNISLLKPRTPHGISKHAFDRWALEQREKPFFWAGLKLFDVYGPREGHKDALASAVWQACNQIASTGYVTVPQSGNPAFKDGEQKHDFVYVGDVVEVCLFFMRHRKNSGFYNVGSGKARSLNEVAEVVFRALNKPVNIKYVHASAGDEPNPHFRGAMLQKLTAVGYKNTFNDIEDGVKEILRNNSM